MNKNNYQFDRDVDSEELKYKNTKSIDKTSREKTISAYKNYFELSGTDENILKQALSLYSQDKQKGTAEFKKKFNKPLILLDEQYFTKKNEELLNKKYKDQRKTALILINPTTFKLEVWGVDTRTPILKLVDSSRNTIQKIKKWIQH